ncbi:MAG: ABC transporter ATP-binding protein/permease [Eggerthellaceae bacterium]|nr:ABC transporter ATP-binding protein/permease [Eggerthellaceae bacterium]
MLELKHLRKAYETGSFTQVALDDVSISFRDNEFVAILGPSGSGKTTLLNVVGGLDQCDSGDLVIDGVSTKEYKDRDWDTYRNNRIGFVFQSYNLIPHQTVLSNVELALTLSGVDREERRQRAAEALDRVGLSEHIHKKPAQLSGGQMQRVAIARALVNNPDILLADEPTGALDSTTSVQIMDLLTEIANDRLVIMVTHNPELAEQYANRIVNLRDGRIESDTNPFNPAMELGSAGEHPTRKTSMSFLTALALSFNNLMTKKGRTIMTAFAGSIGIIGIAAILALANGVNNYIASVEEETLSQYPLQILSSGFDMTSLLARNVEQEEKSEEEKKQEQEARQKYLEESKNKVRVSRLLTTMFSRIGTNDLASLKTYLDSGEAGIDNDVRAIEYSYNVEPQVFLSDISNGVKQVNPDTTFKAFGLGAGSSNSLMSMAYSSDVFFRLPKDENLYINQYEMVAGRWPENYNECILVMSGSGYISDFMLYTLGLRDSQEMKDMISDFMAERKVEAPTDYRLYEYDEILGITFKVVNASDFYQYDSAYGVWKDKTTDSDYMKTLVNDGENLKIVGIVKRAEGKDVAMLRAGINYPYELTLHLMDNASKSQIVREQLADETVDVITGKTFEEEANDSRGGFSMDSLFSIDTSAFERAFQFDPGALAFDPSSLADAISPGDLPAFPQATPDIFDGIDITIDEQTSQDITQAASFLLSQYIVSHPGVPIDQIADGFISWIQDDSTVIVVPIGGESVNMSVRDYLALVVSQSEGMSDIADSVTTAIQNYIAQAVGTYTQQVIQVVMTKTAATVASQMGSSMANAVNFNPNALADAFSFNLSQEDLAEIMASMMNTEERTYGNNLKDFGYANVNEPSSISIYPKSFESKEVVSNALTAYNDKMESTGQDEKVISYTDIVGVLMSSVTEIVDMISAVLIAFVAISLIVSSIMIGVITYISVLERKKEIGILRAMGASKRDISNVFNAETVIEGFIAGILGIAVTAILCIPANAIVAATYDVENIAILPVGAALILILISVVLTFVAGLIPSSAASRKDPVEALRSE